MVCPAAYRLGGWFYSRIYTTLGPSLTQSLTNTDDGCPCTRKGRGHPSTSQVVLVGLTAVLSEVSVVILGGWCQQDILVVLLV